MSNSSKKEPINSLSAFEEEIFNDRFSGICELVLRSFDSLVSSSFWFHCAFFIAMFLEVFLTFLFSLTLERSLWVVLGLASIFMTSFSYFILRIYFQVRGPEALIELYERFIGSSRQLLDYKEGVASHHLMLAEMVTRLSMEMKDREYGYFIFYKVPKNYLRVLEKLGAWWYWYDIFSFREMLFKAAVGEDIQMIQCDPINIEVHAGLANSYVLLSSLYSDPRKDIDVLEGKKDLRWIPPKRLSSLMMKKFQKTASLAIEEFKVINDMAPNDPWVHAQLAYSYHDLQMINEEIKEYETVLELCPEDHESLFRLGVLYFQQEENVKGLQIYEKLKQNNNPKAKHLLKFYGSLSFIDKDEDSKIERL
jgi:tetratricopeptide (TPR) repeat protein